MHVDIIESYDAFAALQENWNDLYSKDPQAQFFLSWLWLSQVFKMNPHRWIVLAVKQDHADAVCIGFFPLWLKTVWSKSQRQFRNEIHLAGPLPWGYRTGFICHPDWEEPIIVSFADKLRDMYWSRISLKYLCVSDRRLDLFLDHFPSSTFRSSSHKLMINEGTTDFLVCPYVELPDDYETYLKKHLSSNARSNIRRFMRRFENSEDLRISTVSAHTLQRDLDILVELWTKTWLESKGDKTKSMARKYRKILQQGFECDMLYMLVLWSGDTPLGALASFVDWQKSSLHCFVSARDESRPVPLIGWVLHAHNIRWAIDNGIKIYDFGQGNQSYKYAYAAKDQSIKYLVVSTRSGVNLNGMLEPSRIDEVMVETVSFLEKGLTEEAKIACEQVLMTLKAK